MKVAVAVIAAITVAAGTAPASGLGKFATGSTCVQQADPIKYHNEQAPHDHMFVGSTQVCVTGAGGTYADLAGKGTTLANPDDTAAYWIPTLVFTDGPRSQTVIGTPAFKGYFAYYRCWNHANTCPGSDTRTIPPDTRLITGSPTGASPTTIANWMCDVRSSRPGPYPTIRAAKCGAATGVVYLTLHLDFPTCWDGVLPDHLADDVGDTSDNAHYAFPIRKGTISPTSGGTCPAGFPIHVTELRETFKWGDGTAAYWRDTHPALSSDLMQRADGNAVVSGTTAHGDFWNTWEQDGFDSMVRNCLLTNNPAGFCNA
jgi:hypothetical protein